MSEFEPPSRKIYLQRQKEELGRRVLGVFPAHYPREILWAHNIVPMEIWDPPLTVDESGAHLQPTICSVVKLGLELILRGHGEQLDAFLFPHTCDSIQNLASIVNDYLGLGKPCFFFYHPKAPYGNSARRFYAHQLEGLLARLEETFGPADPQALGAAVRMGEELSSVLRELYRRRRAGHLAASNSGFYQALRQTEFLHPEDSLPLLRGFLAGSEGAARPGPAVLLSGVLPTPRALLGLLDEHGVRIADDDLLCCGRRVAPSPVETAGPIESLTNAYFSMPPCTTKASPTRTRLEWLMQRIDECGVRGVIFCMVKFCEPELFDVPQLLTGLKRRAVPSLVLEVDVGEGFSGQLATRTEAFIEMLV